MIGKVEMKKRTVGYRIFLVGLTVFLLPWSLFGCIKKLRFNYPYYAYVELIETEFGFSVPGYDVDVTEKAATETNADDLTDDSQERFLYGGTAPRYTIEAPEGFEGVIPHIEALETDKDSSVVYACGYVSDGKLIGFVNMYKGTVGFLFSGGNYGIEQISHAVTFEYDPESDDFKQGMRFDEKNIVAYYVDIVLYWKDRKYYAYNASTEIEQFLIEDKAYDTGFRQQSHASIFTNGKYTVFFMTKAKQTRDYEYAYLYEFASGDFCELTLNRRSDLARPL